MILQSRKSVETPEVPDLPFVKVKKIVKRFSAIEPQQKPTEDFPSLPFVKIKPKIGSHSMIKDSSIISQTGGDISSISGNLEIEKGEESGIQISKKALNISKSLKDVRKERKHHHKHQKLSDISQKESSSQCHVEIKTKIEEEKKTRQNNTNKKDENYEMDIELFLREKYRLLEALEEL